MGCRTCDIPCLLTAIFFFISNLMNLIIRGREYAGHEVTFESNYEAFLQLDPSFIQQQWQTLANNRGLVTATGLFHALAWFLFCIPIIQTAWILSRGGKRKLGVHASIVVFVVGGSLSELISRLMTVGMYNISLYMASNFNLNDWFGANSSDGIGWRVLEMIWIVTSGMLLWIDAFEWLALYATMLFIFVSVRAEKVDDPTFSKRWASFGLLIGILCLFDFLADILKFQSWKAFKIIAFTISTMNTLLLLPIWLLWLGKQLKRAKVAYDSDAGGAELPVQAIGEHDSIL